MSKTESGSDIRESLTRYLDYLENVSSRINNEEHDVLKSDLTGLTTGYHTLDDNLHGLRPGELIVIGGRPMMGCGDLAQNIAEYTAIKQSIHVVMFSLNMLTDQRT